MLGSTFFWGAISPPAEAMANGRGLQIFRGLGLLIAFFSGLAALPAVWGQEAAPAAEKPAAKTPEQKTSRPAKRGAPASLATIEADQQRQVGNILYADGHVDIRYENSRLRADHVEYNDETQVAQGHGNVQMDYMTQHVEASDGRYEVRTGRATFHNVRATFALQRRPLPTLLTSPNPIYVEAEQVDRLDENTYLVHNGWLTVCDPEKPTWKFYAPSATIRLQKNVHLENGNFRIWTIPVMYLPFASFPAEKQRETGFMIPDPGHSTQKGYVLGDYFYWAPTDWMDATIGGDYYSKRGWAEKGDLRMKPWENTKLDVTYYGVIDRGLPQVDAPPLKEGGHEDHVGFSALLPDGWRAVVDFNQLTSLTFRLAWAETFTQAVNSEVHDTVFLTKNFSGFSVDVAALSYKDFLSATPQSSITLRTAPEGRFSSVDQAPFANIPIYFSFQAFAGAEHKGETVTPFDSPAFIPRSELAPTVTMPLYFGPWLSLTPSFTFRSTYYGAQEAGGRFLDRGFFRTTEETSVDIRPPTIGKVYDKGDSKWKHVIEPEIVYQYVTGVNDYERFIRFDEDETLTNTNEVEYGITQRLYERTEDGETEELVSWRLVQKYFFDQTFGGALLPGQRNVFQTLDSLTPFAFADTARKYSPIVSDLRVTPGKRFDTQLRIDYDPKRGQMTAIGTLVKWKPYRQSYITLAHFSTINLPTPNLQNPPDFEFFNRSNQVRVLAGYGDLTKPGWNVAAGTSYDFTLNGFQNQVAQIGYNGSCCGLGFEYRRFTFGNIRNETRYGFVLRISNLGSAGNVRRQEKIF